MQAILFALFSYLTWGTGDIFGAIAARKIGGYSTSFWIFLSGIVLFSWYVPFAWHDLQNYTPLLLLFNFGIGVLYITGNVTFNQALEQSNVPLVGTIAASFTAVTVILSMIFFGERVSSMQLMAITLIFAGIILSTLHSLQRTEIRFLQEKGIHLALWSMLAWGTYFSLVRIVVNRVGWFWPHYISFSMFIVILPFILRRGIKLKNPIKHRVVASILASAILLRSGDFALNYAISRNLTTVVAPIAGSYATLFVLLSFLVFREPLRPRQMIGIIVTLCGIVALSVLSI